MSRHSRPHPYPEWSRQELGWIVSIGAAVVLFCAALLIRSASTTPGIRTAQAMRGKAVTGRARFGTLSPDRFVEPQARQAYAVAARMPRTLAELPCYCSCDQIGHKNLLDCFKDEHAEYCIICQDSALWAEKRVKEHASIKTIRDELRARYSRNL